MANDITLTSAIRSNLLSMQRVADQQAAVGSRLSTGLKVASAVDDPVAYFQAKSMKDRASDLRTIKDSMGQGIKTLENAIKALESAEKIVKQMKGLALSAQAESDATKRTTLSQQFEGLAEDLDKLLTDAEYQGVNLVAGASSGFTAELNVTLNEDSSATLNVVATDNLSQTLAIDEADGDWSTQAQATGDLTDLDSALGAIRTNMQTLGNDLAFLKIRETFASDLVNTLEAGAGQLVNADLNEESANMLALQTRQQMATNTLSMANQAEQSILQLFR